MQKSTEVLGSIILENYIYCQQYINLLTRIIENGRRIQVEHSSSTIKHICDTG